MCTARHLESDALAACAAAEAAGQQCVANANPNALAGRRLFAAAPETAPEPPKAARAARAASAASAATAAAAPPKTYPDMPKAELVVGIVHVPGFAHRAAMLAKTKAALADYTAVVACDTRGDPVVPEGCTVTSDGLGEARNDLSRARAQGWRDLPGEL